MADNSNYPGMPFPFPFPQMQPPNTAHHDGQPHHAPPPPPGWNLPGIQQYPPQPYAPQPGHTENQNSLPQFPAAGLSWPPQIPTEWLQLMQNSMQAGMVPPPLPGLNFPPPSMPHTPQAPATPTAFAPFPPQFTPQPPAPLVERVQEVTDSDKEDGEVTDGDAASRTPAVIAMRQRYPEPPRSAPRPTATTSHAEEAYNPERPSAGQTTPKVHTPKVAPQESAPVNEVDRVQQQREEAKQFIRLLNANNIGYHALAKENIDVELLRGMYRSMNLPSEPEPIPLPKTNGAIAAKLSTESQPKELPSMSTNITATAAAAASAAASPVDRKDYLARLQAAKLARQSGPAKASPQQSPPTTTASPAPSNGTPQAISTPTKKPSATDVQKARQTELIKQRLEALKAQSKQAATQKPALSAQPPPAPSARASASASASAPQTPAASFANIPGLFMNGYTSSGNGASTPSRQPQGVPQKRPAPSDTSMSTPRGSVTPYNRQYGQSPHAHQDDSMIIEVSDDESNGSDMDIDEDQGPSASTAIRQAPISIPGFPPRQAPILAAASAVSTPGPQTPATLARTGELSTKEQELAALKLTLKKKLAEQKRIKEAAEAAAAAASTATVSVPGNQETLSHQASLPPLARAQEAIAPDSVHIGTSATDSSRDRKRRRRTEIQEQLPTLDDEIASNEAEMARLAKDLERLKSNNEKIMQDKQRLTKELEELGIDTEGMSHADMRATKDKIERAMSPAVDHTAQQTFAATLSSPSSTEQHPPATASVKTANTEISEMPPQQSQPPCSNRPTLSQYGRLPGLGPAVIQAPASTLSQTVPQPVQARIAGSPSQTSSTANHLESREELIKAADTIDRASATPMDDDEDFYSPPPPNEVAVSAKASMEVATEPRVEQTTASAPSPSEEGEVEMSESSDEEEEYEPEEAVLEVEEAATEQPTYQATEVKEPVSATPPQQTQLPELQIETSQSIGQSQVSTEDEETYEPPDVDDEMTEVAPLLEDAQVVPDPLEASSPGDADEGAMDIATSSSVESDGSESDSDSDGETQSEAGDTGSQAHATQPDTNLADDLAPGLQPNNAVAIIPATEHVEDELIVEDEPEPPRFTPYESSLRMFKSYRYHPQYSQDVNGGFLSMTYSHQIDDEKPLCPFESAGGSCNDPECPNQHFRGMGITGEKLLVQLGTANPGKTPEEKQQWNDGLRSVLKDLRQKNVKDPNGIAQEIVKYRRQFLNDDTRVVNL